MKTNNENTIYIKSQRLISYLFNFTIKFAMC